ncbi:MAG: hypothetical protein H0V92_05880 [Pseudonocardiales bacterium]|nr:hypothetical protein [Pseudonocardiales bacterium]
MRRLLLALLCLPVTLVAQTPDSSRTDSVPVYRSTTRLYYTRQLPAPPPDTVRLPAPRPDTVRLPAVDTVCRAGWTCTPPSPPPPPPAGTTYFLADAESGNLSAWSLPWGAVSDGSDPLPVVTADRAKVGTQSYKYEITNPALEGHYSQTLTGNPQRSMGSPNGRYRSGYFSFWAYINAGYTAPGWNMLLGWMTGVSGAPSPISHVGLEVRNGILQVVYVLKNCSVGLYTCPSIPGYTLNGGWYTMTAGSPAGVKAFPRSQWVHLSFYYKMAASNGQVTVWQDGVKIMDLTAPTMNTFGGHSSNLTNTAGDMTLQFGIYGGTTSGGTQRLYVDDFKVTDVRPAN